MSAEGLAPAAQRRSPDIGPTYVTARRLFRIGLALVAACAFGSLWVQLDGLAGSGGIVPASESFDAFRAGRWGVDWSWRPSLLWFSTSDAMLHGLCAAGLALATLLLLDLAPALCALLLWVIYLSLFWACGPFLYFQWDTLLLETLLLAAFWLPWRWGWARGAERRDVPLARWLVWWVLFRLMFESGVVKLTAGDPSWWNLTALSHHYMTQPLPHPLSWFVFHLPDGLHQLSTAIMFVVELVVPFLMFVPRQLRVLRLAAALALVGLQLAIAGSGNYGFFGLLTVVLCLSLVDDGWFRRLRKAGLDTAATPAPETEPEPASAPDTAPDTAPPLLLQRVAVALFALPVLLLSGCQLLDLAWARESALTEKQIEQGIVVTALDEGLPAAVDLARTRAAPWASVNTYGLFRVMTTTRPEIVVQGSLDGVLWKDYSFRWKAGSLDRRTAWVQPHMPRLDWQLWFEALAWERAAGGRMPYRASPWFAAFLQRLVDAEPSVLALLEADPFLDKPPRFVRATLYDYRFATPEEHDTEGVWWVRQRIEPGWLRVER